MTNNDVNGIDPTRAFITRAESLNVGDRVEATLGGRTDLFSVSRAWDDPSIGLGNSRGVTLSLCRGVRGGFSFVVRNDTLTRHAVCRRTGVRVSLAKPA